jgi:hypothetical protein
MQDLEASPFVRNVRLLQTDQIRSPDNKLIYSFALEGEYQLPTADLIKTVAIFSREGD